MSHLQSPFIASSLDSPRRFSSSCPFDLSLGDTAYRMDSKEEHYYSHVRMDLYSIENSRD
jgi:hypothetical protein